MVKRKYAVGQLVMLPSPWSKAGKIVGHFTEGHKEDRRVVYLIRCPNDECTYNVEEYDLAEIKAG